MSCNINTITRNPCVHHSVLYYNIRKVCVEQTLYEEPSLKDN